MKTKSFILASLLACGLWACSDEEVAPTTDTAAQINLSFKTMQSTMVFPEGGRVMQSGLTFSSGFITIREVQFEAETDSDSVEVNLEQITKIDFATGASTPDISSLTIPAGTYQEVEVEIELQDEGDEPAMVLEGTYTDADGVDHPVRFEFNSGETFEVEKEGVISFAGGESIIAEITFDPSAWFGEVSAEQLLEATKDAQGVIVISSTQNAEIFDTVADGLDLATEVEISK